MNYLLIGDCHLNYRSIFIQSHLDKFNKYYNQNFENLLKNIQKVGQNFKLIFLGDLLEPIPLYFDFINLIKLFFTLKNLKNDIYILVGNHDIYYRNTEKSLLYEFYNELKNYKKNCYLIEPGQILQISKKVFIVGCFADLKNLLSQINNSIIFTHQDIHQLNKNELKNNIIISGHIHNSGAIKSNKNIYYIGSIIPLNFRDAFTIDKFAQLNKYKFDYGLAKFSEKTKKLNYISLNNKVNFYKININSQKDLDIIFKIISNSDRFFVVEFIVPSLKENFNFNDLNNLDNLIFRIKPKVEEIDLSNIIQETALDFEKFDLIEIVHQTLKNMLKELNFKKEIKDSILKELINSIKKEK